MPTVARVPARSSRSGAALTAASGHGDARSEVLAEANTQGACLRYLLADVLALPAIRATSADIGWLAEELANALDQQAAQQRTDTRSGLTRPRAGQDRI